MANIKSAKKRILQSQKKTEFNKFRKTRIRSVIKSLNSLISNKKKDDSRKSFLALESIVSKTENASKVIFFLFLLIQFF